MLLKKHFYFLIFFKKRKTYLGLGLPSPSLHSFVYVLSPFYKKKINGLTFN